MEEVRRPKRGVRQSLASIVLGFELIVVFLASLVAFGLKVQPGPIALIGGGIVCLAILVTMALLRHEWAFGLGWVLQGVIVATGIFVPAMWVIGLVFAGMWVYCMVVGGRIDRQNAATQGTES